MIQGKENLHSPSKITESYNEVVQHMKELYQGNISDPEAHEAARNLIGFCKLLLEIKAKRSQNLAQEH